MKQFQSIGSKKGTSLYAAFYCIVNETISACRILKVEGSYMRASTVLGAIVLVLIITSEAISASMKSLFLASRIPEDLHSLLNHSKTTLFV